MFARLNIDSRYAQEGRNMSSATTLLRPPLTALRQLRGFFTDRTEQRGLEDELAIYTSEKDLTEIGAILDRYSDTETGDIRRILGARI
jgi:hypothetical protein